MQKVFCLCFLNAPTHRRKKDALRLSDYLKNFVKIFAIVVARGLCTALFDVSAADTDGREAGKNFMETTPAPLSSIPTTWFLSSKGIPSPTLATSA